ncbi:MAG: aminotransferase class V-fold PLP-dependent enzyme [Bacteroidia bacterium]
MNQLSDIRKQFPILNRQINGKPLIYFDNGATTQKPSRVINRIIQYYEKENSNIHRGVHTLSREATELFENSRIKVAEFVNASKEEIIFTSGTTDGINIIANGINLPQGSEIIISEQEHHSNILPWQEWCKKNDGTLKVIPINEDGTLKISELKTLLTDKTKLVAVTHVSNTLGVINPVKEIISTIKSFNNEIICVVDGAQSVPHLSVDVKAINADYFVFSGHKMYAPTGIGVLYGKSEILQDLNSTRVGGGTIKTVSFNKTEYVDGPLRFEAGTPNIEGVLALEEAINFMNDIEISKIEAYEHALMLYAQEKLVELPEVNVYAPIKEKAAVISFNVLNQHPFDVGTLLDKYGIAVRTGHHCTQPLMQVLKTQGTIRASFAVYNTKEEVDSFLESLKKVIKMLS